MPRTARIVVMGYPHHIIQRGHNRQVVFASDEDYRYYLDNLREWKEKLGCKIYAYCLMTNHVHLIVDPGEDGGNLARLMKRVAGRQTRYLNKLEKRTGSLWEGRFKSSTISADEYLLACSRYVELNPVRAGIVADPGDYRWSSYGSKTGNKKEAWLDYDPFILYFKKSRTLMIGISRKQPISRRSLSPLTIASTPPATAQERKISSHGSRQTPWMFSQDSTTSK